MLLLLHKCPLKSLSHTEMASVAKTVCVLSKVRLRLSVLALHQYVNDVSWASGHRHRRPNKAEIHAGRLLMLTAKGEVCSSMASIVVRQCSLSHPPPATSSCTLQSCQHPPATAVHRAIKALQGMIKWLKRVFVLWMDSF